MPISSTATWPAWPISTANDRSLIPCRGYYWRSALVALDWRDGKLTQRWLFDTAAVKGATGKRRKTSSVFTRI